VEIAALEPVEEAKVQALLESKREESLKAVDVRLDDDLAALKNKYDRKTLKDNIYAINFMDVLKTQKIDASFAVKYLMNKNYDLNDEYNITADTVLKFQPHIKMFEILQQIMIYDADDDSVDDFETVSKRN
jgi:hypothetical protein